MNFRASDLLIGEAVALRDRLDRVRPFSLTMPAVPAAMISSAAQLALARHMAHRTQEVRSRIESFLDWIRSPDGRRSSPGQKQRRFTTLRLSFNNALSQFDLFSDVITQRSEHGHGTWLAGLDAVASDSLRLPGLRMKQTPVMCYLDRGFGAAIRRVRTRLPGGSLNPVAIIRVPRERMVGSSIASSLIHEVGHQAAAFLDLVGSIRPVLAARLRQERAHRQAWTLWGRWVSEILADLWSVSRVGVTSTRGLIGVVSLPRPFVFRARLNEPHPSAWIRVILSCRMGRALYPDSQWKRLEGLWRRLYPRKGTRIAGLLRSLEATLPEFVSVLLRHRPARLRGRSLQQALTLPDRRPRRLRALFSRWCARPELMQRARPSQVFAVIGQARSDGRMRPQDEGKALSRMLTFWSMSRALDRSAAAAHMAGTNWDMESGLLDGLGQA